MIDLYVKSFFKSTLEQIPIVGRIMSDSLFEYRGKLKQNRINEFVEILKDPLQNANPQIEIDAIKSEDFSDLFENVLKHTSQTRSKTKLVAFKNILLKGMRSKSEIEYAEIFSQLLFQIHEKLAERIMFWLPRM